MRNKINAKIASILLAATLIAGTLLSPVKITTKVQAADSAGETMAEAIPIELGGNASCTFNDKDNEAHYFKFTVPKNLGNQWITFTVTNYAERYMWADLLDSQGNTLHKSEQISSQKTYAFETRTEGADTLLDGTWLLSPDSTYYIKAYRSKNIGNVTVSVAGKKDDNWGTYDKSASVTVGKWKNGKLEKWDDIDSYCVTLPKNNRKYTFNISSDNFIKVSFVNGNRVTLSEVSVDANKTNNTYSVKGKGQKIYVRIQAQSNKVTNANYSLKVSIQKKTISKLSLSKYKRNGKTIKGITIANATVKVKAAKRTYTVKSNKKGNFTVKLKKKLKSKDKIKVSVSKTGYKTLTKTYTVK